MKSMIAILALLGVASATFYGSFFYPEHHQFWGPYQHLYHEEPIHTPWIHKFGQTFPWASHQFHPFAKYFHGVPYKTHFEYPTYTEKEHVPFVPEHVPFVPEHVPFVPHLPTVWEKYPVEHKFYPHKDITFSKHISTPVEHQFYEHEVPQYYYPYGQKFVKPYEKFVPHYEKFVPHYESFLPHFEKKWEGEFVKPVDTVLAKTLEAEKVVEIPKVHEQFPFVTSTFDKFVPYWSRHFGYKPIVPYHHETTEYYPKYWEHRPYHYGLY